ncbi:TPA: hypothetical protein ACVB54_001669 [Acinetobacter baumannii]|nr:MULTISPECIES: hypothetical protein [Acinetobacter]EMF0780318.1 hypothetical protein [Acinetobacter baumannii]MBT0887547.1 hypothetical protein [Acinetobacter towneri]NWJ92954.1 hypothetical protein [Acinetobacter sp. Swhac1]HCT9561314.1 hypothetical protein [Acinetobacter baumannii]
MRKIQLCCFLAGWTGQSFDWPFPFVTVIPTPVQSVTITVGSDGVS